MCDLSDVGHNSGEGDPYPWTHIVEHTEKVGHNVKMYVPVTPYHRFSKEKFFCIEEKTVETMNDAVRNYALTRILQQTVRTMNGTIRLSIENNY